MALIGYAGSLEQYCQPCTAAAPGRMNARLACAHADLNANGCVAGAANSVLRSQWLRQECEFRRRPDFRNRRRACEQRRSQRCALRCAAAAHISVTALAELHILLLLPPLSLHSCLALPLASSILFVSASLAALVFPPSQIKVRVHATVQCIASCVLTCACLY